MTRAGRAAAWSLAIAWLLVAAAAWAVDFPALTGRVVDDANLLSAAARQSLTKVLAAHEAKTTNQVVVVTVPSLQGLTIEQFGYQLGRHWGIGQKDKDNGVLLIVAPNERKVRIEVGYGLEGTLTDALSSGIIRNTILPEFRAGRFEDGILQGTDAILAVLGDPQAAGSGASRTYPSAMWSYVLLAVPILGFLVLFGIFIRASVKSPGGLSLRSFQSPPRRRWSGLGGSGGGGGFSGGGGSFGGGGSSGSW